MKTLSPFLLVLLTSLTSLAADFTTRYASKALEGLRTSASAAPKAGPEAQAKAVASLKKGKLLFVENNGQLADDKGKLHPEILFTANAAGVQVYVTGTSIHYVFTKVERETENKKIDRADRHVSIKSVSTHRFTLELEGANRKPELIKQEATPYYENYYLAHCPNGVVAHSYEKFMLKGVYPGVDWVVYSNGQGLKYDFVLAKGSDASKIRLKVKDAAPELNSEGDLVLNTSLGRVIEDKPVSFQEGRTLETRFKELGNKRYGFDVPDASATQPLTIDPSVAWATYYGGNRWDLGESCATDATGNVYLAGETPSINFPVSGAFQGAFAGTLDAYLVKFDSTGDRIWATYYGGRGEEFSYSSATDTAGNVYLAGYTGSDDFPVAGAFQGMHSLNPDAYLVKFTSTGSRLWATYYGGSGDDYGKSCATDIAGNVYLAGYTSSDNFPVAGAFQGATAGGSDGFLVKFTSTGNRLWATYYGGSGSDEGNSCATDSSGNVYLAGWTSSGNFPVAGAFQRMFAGGVYFGDVFLVKFTSTGSRLWATYYGGTYDEYCNSCATDGSGNLYLAGWTGSGDFPVAGAFQGTFAGGSAYGEAFLVKFDRTGSRLWATYYGGSSDDAANSCATDGAGNVYLAGWTGSIDFPVAGGGQVGNAGASDAYLVKFTSSGSRLWATYYGGSGADYGQSCATDVAGNVYLVGITESTDVLVAGAFQGTYAGGTYDAFLAKIQDTTTTLAVSVRNKPSLTLHPNPAANSVQLSLSSGTIKQVDVIDPLGRTRISTKEVQNNTLDISTLAAGTYMVRVVSTDGVAFRKFIKQ